MYRVDFDGFRFSGYETKVLDKVFFSRSFGEVVLGAAEDYVVGGDFCF